MVAGRKEGEEEGQEEGEQKEEEQQEDSEVKRNHPAPEISALPLYVIMLLQITPLCSWQITLICFCILMSF